ncbi:MAG: DUF599 domain-containing protein [Paracoccus denitrificans]|nr:MAG: DUF599 domain-containing protein [Paracoccus denitrificans]PZO83561.1 MAG: DUF599 domain-containing protein [Paracoccus denitrificans]
MEILTHLTLGKLDLLAITLLIVCWFLLSHYIEHPPRNHPSVSVLMRHYRREWMARCLERDNRIFDGNILGSLREGLSFYASACIFAIGGGLALIGNSDPLAGIARDLDATNIPALLWKLKLVPLILFLANAFLKIVWAHRLFGYCAVLMAAVPNRYDDPRGPERAAAAAEVNIHAARNFNAGLRAIYFALGSLGWFAGPWGLILGTLIVSGMTVRREFASGSRAAILKDLKDELRSGL